MHQQPSSGSLSVSPRAQISRPGTGSRPATGKPATRPLATADPTVERCHRPALYTQHTLRHAYSLPLYAAKSSLMEKIHQRKAAVTDEDKAMLAASRKEAAREKFKACAEIVRIQGVWARNPCQGRKGRMDPSASQSAGPEASQETNEDQEVEAGEAPAAHHRNISLDFGIQRVWAMLQLQQKQLHGPEEQQLLLEAKDVETPKQAEDGDTATEHTVEAGSVPRMGAGHSTGRAHRLPMSVHKQLATQRTDGQLEEEGQSAPRDRPVSGAVSAASHAGGETPPLTIASSSSSVARDGSGSIPSRPQSSGNRSSFLLPHRPLTASSSTLRRTDGACCGPDAALTAPPALAGGGLSLEQRTSGVGSSRKLGDAQDIAVAQAALTKLRLADAGRDTTDAQKNTYLARLNACITQSTGYVETRRVRTVTMPMFQALHPVDGVCAADVTALPDELRGAMVDATATAALASEEQQLQQSRRLALQPSLFDSTASSRMRGTALRPPRAARPASSAAGKEYRKVLVPWRLDNGCPVADEPTCSAEALDADIRAAT